MQVKIMSNDTNRKRQRLSWEVEREDKLKNLVENYWK